MSSLKIFADEVLFEPSIGGSAIESSFFIYSIYSVLICLASTIIIELIVSLCLGVRGKNLWKVILAQIVTNPPLVLISALLENVLIDEFGRVSYGLVFMICVVGLEILAIMVESRFYKSFLQEQPKCGPAILSLVANLISFCVGLVLSVATMI